jgi:hypothetical protein
MQEMAGSRSLSCSVSASNMECTVSGRTATIIPQGLFTSAEIIDSDNSRTTKGSSRDGIGSGEGGPALYGSKPRGNINKKDARNRQYPEVLRVFNETDPS